MNTIEQKFSQQQRVVADSPPAIVSFVQLLPLLFGGFILFAILIAVMPLVWDHGGWIGRYVDVLLCILMTGCFILVIVRFYTLAGVWWHMHYRTMLHRNIVEAGDVVIRVHKDGSYDHLSAEHESAKILAMPKDEPMILEIDYQQKIMDLRRETGWGRGRIAKELSTKGFPVTEAMVRSVLQNMGDKEEY